MNTSSLWKSLSQLRLLVCGAAENAPSLLLIDQLLRDLTSHDKHHVSILSALQKELSKAKKEAKALRKEVSSLKATISNQKSDLDMLYIKNSHLQLKLTKLLQKEPVQQPPAPTIPDIYSRQTKQMGIQCDILSPKEVDLAIQHYLNERRDNGCLRLQLGLLQAKVVEMEQEKWDCQETSTQNDSDCQERDAVLESSCKSGQISGSGSMETVDGPTKKTDALASNNMVGRLLQKFGNLFTSESTM